MSEFEHLATTSGITDLIVQNVTHWKQGPDSLPFYHEFITVKTAPWPQVALSSAELSRDSTRTFDWSSLAIHGLAFRIDRGQLPTHQSPNSPSQQLDPRAHLVPIDLIEIIHPALFAPDRTDRRARNSRIRFDLPPYVPLLAFDRNGSQDTQEDDRCALRVRDFIFSLYQHSEHAMVYTAHEWNTWELAPSVIRFLLRYRLVWVFNVLLFSDQFPTSTDAEQRSEGFEYAYKLETGAFLDEFIFGSEVRSFIFRRTTHQSRVVGLDRKYLGYRDRRAVR